MVGLDVVTLQKLLADDTARQQAARHIQTIYDINLPTLNTWNYFPCRQHRSHGAPVPLCRKCGINFRRHQRVGVPWLFLAKKALLADFVGSGKTIHAGGLLALMQEAGEFETQKTIIVVGRPSAILQWEDELNRMLPRLRIQTATGTPKQRIEKYLEPWDVMLIGPQMLIKDHERLERFSLNLLICDDLDALRNRGTRTAYLIRRFSLGLPRTVVMSATPLQKKLHELYNILEVVGADKVIGSKVEFEHFFVRREKVTVFNSETGSTQLQEQFMGYKNLDRFKEIIRPYALRRTPDDIEDVTLPRINPINHWLDLYDDQRRKYEELRQGVLRIIKSDEFGNMSVIRKRATALAKLIYGSQICDGLASIGQTDGEGASVKLDWLMDKLTGDLAEEKVVVFCLFKETIRALQVRMEAAGIDHVTIWGEEKSMVKRRADIERFWGDCPVLIGTSAIEQSLNLQCARHLVNVGQIQNPARMLQLAGRIARDGSAYEHVWVHNLLCGDTHEESFLRKMNREQALADWLWEEESQLFERISPMEMLQLIGRNYL